MSQPDLVSGLVFAAIGGGFVLSATRHELGTAAQMGSAQFPMIVGGCLAFFGLLIASQSVLVCPLKSGPP